MLLTLYDNGVHGYMPIEDAQKFDQRPFRSMLVQGWAAYRPGRGFHVTPKGRDTMLEFQSTDILRKHPESPLTAYFDPTAYGLAPSKKAKVHVMSKRGAAA
jgi:hypothetical protein